MHSAHTTHIVRVLASGLVFRCSQRLQQLSRYLAVPLYAVYVPLCAAYEQQACVALLLSTPAHALHNKLCHCRLTDAVAAVECSGQAGNPLLTHHLSMPLPTGVVMLCGFDGAVLSCKLCTGCCVPSCFVLRTERAGDGMGLLPI